MTTAAPDPLAESVTFHMGLAEQGKVLALRGDHRMAMVYYREAMRLAVAKGAPELFFRHYLECMLESLEKAGATEEVLSYCDKALAHHRGLRPVDDEQRRLIALDKASVLQRQGVNRLRRGEVDGAREALREATQVARAAQLSLEPATTIYGWLARGFRVDPRRLEAELERQAYWSVRPDTVQADRAVALPAQHLAALTPGL